jgi:hypothetical protein
MIDLAYILATIGFFAAMIGYVAGCERLGRTTNATDEAAR